MNNLVKNVDKVSKRMDDVEKSMEFVNKQFEISKTDHTTLTSSVSQLQAEYNDMSNLKSDLSNLHDKHLDLQTRSMRENLVFTGLPLTNDTEDTEDIIKQFMRNEMKMDSVVEFHRAHRFGKESFVKDSQNRNLYTTRPIVCRFKSFKDRELVRYAASALKGTRFEVNEQYPKEINDRRKLIWPYFKEAKSQKRKVHLKKDRLFIDGAEFIPADRNDEARMETNERQLYIERGARPKTTTNADDAISEIEIELHNMYKDSQYVCLFGDFNSRTGTLADYYDMNDFDDPFVNELIDFNEFSEIGILDDRWYTEEKKLSRSNSKWEHEKSTDFTRNINRDEFNELLSHILEIHDDISKVDQSSVNEIVTNVTKILLDSAEKNRLVYLRNIVEIQKKIITIKNGLITIVKIVEKNIENH
ncbi:unnamed protein product [Mytilus coruscus]|uniref:Endonuclease/exonuclease/phosphatase domain-containing protein n=1 Tax=Mytilus coruscus TaxID=42192 RepID=A0A6J8DG89_MYTCO|nr:unnamed protein product [Mytilus coruscus]